MTVQTINIGNIVNDGLGDDLRTAFQKVNANFAELSYLGNINAVNTTGNAGVGLFKEKTDVNGNTTLVFKTILAGPNITVESLPNTVKISGAESVAFRSIATDAGTVSASFSKDISMLGGIAPGGTNPDIEVTSLGSTIRIKSLFPITDTLTGYNFGTITGQPNNVVELLLTVSNIDFGTVDLPSGLNLDFGTIIDL
jgi:hypothetical protein